MPSSATNSVYGPGVKRFWLPSAANACRVVPLAAHSPGSPAQLEYDRRREAGAAAEGPGFRIFATVSSFQSLVQLFFTDRLRTQLGASPHTIAAYRDTFRLLLQFASKHLRRAPSQLRTEDIDAPFVGKFLEHLELTRGNCARTRNNRLAALHAFFRYVAVSEPGLALHCQRVLTIPSKRYDRGPVAFLTEEEAAALVAAPNAETWIGKRDRALLLVAVQTGLRNSEITSLR